MNKFKFVTKLVPTLFLLKLKLYFSKKKKISKIQLKNKTFECKKK